MERNQQQALSGDSGAQAGISPIARHFGLGAHLIIAVNAIGLVLLVAAMIVTTGRFNRAWADAESSEFTKLTAVSRFEAAFGYGGVIHSLKNYVIRGEERYAAQTTAALEDARCAILDYRSAKHLRADEQRELDQLDALVSSYEAALSRLGDHGLSAQEADRLAKVDDTPYAAAIARLRESIADDYDTAGHEIRDAASSSRAIALVVGAAILLTVIPAGVWLIDRMKAHVLQEHSRSESLAAFAQRSTNGMIRTDAARRITWVNEGFERISGFTFEESVGRSPGELLQFNRTDPETIARMHDALDRGERFRGRVLNRSKAGREYWLDLEILPERDASGELTGFLGIENDITELLDAKSRAEELAAERAWLAAAYERSSDPMVVTDFEGRIRYANPAAVSFDRSLNHNPEPGQRAIIFTPERVGEGIPEEIVAKVCNGGRFSGRVQVMVARDVPLPVLERGVVAPRRVKWLHVQATSILTDDGQADGILLIKRDIDERVRRERATQLRAEGAEARARVGAILASEGPLRERLDAAVGAVLDMDQLEVQRKGGVFLLEPGDDRLRMFSHVGNFSDEFLADEASVPLGSCLCGKAALSGELIVSDNCFEDEGHEHAWPGMTPHGHYIVPLEGEDGCVGVLFLYTDVCPSSDTERVESLLQIGEMFANAIMRDRRRRELSQVKSALDLSNDCVFMFEAESLNFIYANHGATEQVGYDAAELESMTPVDIKPHFDRETFLEAIAPLRQNPGESMIFRTEHEHRDGRRIPVEISLQLIPGLGASGRFVAVVRDITEQLDNERTLTEAKDRAEAASRSKTEFLANMSHEIRTPMTAILGYADLLDGGLDGDQDRVTDAIQTIRTNADHLLTIINDILDVSKIEAGQLRIETLETSPADIVRDVVFLLAPRAAGKGIDLRATFETAVPERIESDPTRLRQVLLNIVGNAIKFTEVGSVSIRIACKPDRSEIVFDVADTGIGMTDEQVDQISRFAAFTQADASTTRKYGGTGLGLRISNALAIMLGGGLTISSEPERGSTFTITVGTGDLAGIPMVEPDELAATPRQPSADRSEATETARATPLEGIHVLLAEDGPDNRRLIGFHLKKAGARVTFCDNGLIAAETVERAEGETVPHVILMDMQMPELDGYGATRRLRSAGCNIPIIALTAHAMEGDRERCLAAGCDEYLTKPIDKAAMIEACALWANAGRRASDAA